jgi:hypothetical protein
MYQLRGRIPDNNEFPVIEIRLFLRKGPSGLPRQFPFLACKQQK